MTVAIGARIGSYEVLAPLGVGGMGEVYRARDAKLNRDVALKILPSQFALDPERLARFKREAQVLASLDHPNIGAIYGFEDADGVHALVLQLVEGPTLADRIAQGPVPIEEALPIAKQIAEALEAAHEQGIVHRDLKPANIKLRSDGAVKVLDFGLAKLAEAGAASGVVGAGEATRAAALSQSPTITTPAVTVAGVILGTAAYMSPEQAKGRPADKRSDIWAFGCVLYEMLTGRRAFEGEDISEILAAVIKGQPDWSALPEKTPVAIQRLIRRCVEKDPRQRLHDAADARLDLQEAIISAPEEVAATVIARSAPAWRHRVLWGIAIITSAAAGFSGWRLSQLTRTSSAVQRFNVSFVPAMVAGLNSSELAVSPDGTRVVYPGVEGGKSVLYIRGLDQLEARAIRGTDDAVNPFFSPDGEWIGFFTGPGTASARLKKVSIRGGSPITLCDAPVPVGGSWGADDVIVFGPTASAMTNANTGWMLSRISAKGGEPETLLAPDIKRGETRFGWPDLLPGGKALLISVAMHRNTFEESHIAVLSLGSRTYRTLIDQGYHAKYLPTGHIVYMLDGNLMAVPFDAQRVEVTGPPAVMVEGIRSRIESGSASFGISRTGFLVYAAGPESTAAQRTLVWVDRAGREQPIAAAPVRAYTSPRISPDGRRVALDLRDQEQDIWIWNIESQNLTRLTSDPAGDIFPVWSPDSRYVVFASNRAAGGTIYRQAVDGFGEPERLIQTGNYVPNAISPDGTRLVVRNADAGAVSHLSMLSLGGEPRPTPLLHSQYVESNPDISPDGRWLAYESDRSGQLEIYVRPFPNVDSGGWQVSSGGGTRPVWAQNRRELFYLIAGTGGGRSRMMSVPVQTSGSFAHGQASMLFEGQYLVGTAFSRSYDVSPEGQRFLMIKTSGSPGAETMSGVVVVLNWFEELKQRVPAK